MNKKVIVFLSAFFASFNLISIDPEMSTYNSTLLMGSIQFPQLNSVPNIRVYGSGHKVTCVAREENSKLIFALPEEKYKRHFHLLITETDNIQYESVPSEPNVIKCLTVDTKKPYKFYALRLNKDILCNPMVKSMPGFDFAGKQSTQEEQAVWDIREQRIETPNGKIPDETIIVCYNPLFVDRLEGGSVLELPKIVMKDSIVDLVGSEHKLHEISAELLLASINLDTIHSSVQQSSRSDLQRKTILAINA